MQGVSARASVWSGRAVLLMSGRREAKLARRKAPVSQRLPGRPCPGAPLPCVRCAQGLAPECQQRGGRGHVPARGLAE